MQVFISWSGTKSKALGEVLRDWLPGVLQMVKPYFTPEDTEKGSGWRSEIADALQASQFGIFCLTREGLQSRWMMFEAGAIANALGTTRARVCPLLFDLEKTEIKEPLSQFQAAQFNKKEVGQLIADINARVGEAKLADGTREGVFEKWWPELEEKVTKIMTEPDTEAQEEPRKSEDMVKEILELVRGLARETAELKVTPGSPMFRAFEEGYMTPGASGVVRQFGPPPVGYPYMQGNMPEFVGVQREGEQRAPIPTEGDGTQ